MAVKTLPTWIVVLDGAQARFFALRQGEEGQVFEETAETLVASQRESVKPGRSFATGKARGVVEPRQNARKLEKHDFICEVAGVLDAAAGRRAYSKLVLVAPPRSMGELREVLSDRVLATLTHEIPKTLTRLPTDALWAKLSGLLLTAAKPLSKKIKGKAQPGVPVSVVFRGTEGSPAIHADALRYAAKLSRKYERVETCKVTIAAPRRPLAKGKTVEVSLNVVFGGRKLTSKGAGGGLQTHGNAHTAVRDAFDALERRIDSLSAKHISVAKPRQAAARRMIAGA